MGKVRFTTIELRDICLKHEWFTGGSCEAYEKLFDRCSEGADFDELALLIWLCTPDVDRREIYYQLLVDKAERRFREFESVVDHMIDTGWDSLESEDYDLLTATRKGLESIANA